MQIIKLGAVTLNQTPLAFNENAKNIINAINFAKTKNIKVLSFPELCISGYDCEDHFFASYTTDKSWDKLHEIKEYTENICISVGLPLFYNNFLLNVVVVIANKEIVAIIPKQNLAIEGLHYESRWFKGWERGKVSIFKNNNITYPIGDLVIDFDSCRIGVEICEDAWIADRPSSYLSKKGIDIILNPSASHFAFQKQKIRIQYIREASRACNCAYVYSNLLGCESGRTIYDGDCIIASEGKIVSINERFQFVDYEVIEANINLDINRLAKKKVYLNNIQEVNSNIIYSQFKLHDADNLSCIDTEPHITVLNKYEEFSLAVSQGLFDYLRKSKLKGFVVSLSGGADSTAVSLLVYYSILRAYNSFATDSNVEGFLQKLNIKIDPLPTSVFTFVNALLTCVYQKTSNNSKETEESAIKFAEEIGASFFNISIDEIVQKYTDSISQVLSKNIDWDVDDLSKQNIQSRVRSPSIWFVANLKSSLLLTTGNRSECSVGYCTMDGDSSGGFNPIGGVSKTFIKEWLKYVETNSICGLPAISSLSYVNKLSPSAELRPLSTNQTDETDLMPYFILNQIEECLVKYKMSPVDTFKRLSLSKEIAFKDLSKNKLFEYIRKFYKLWSINQWKRERYAPCFHLDDYNVDPRSWCRFPILSSNFEDELKELDEYASKLPL